MPRKINPKLIKRLLDEKDLKPLLDYIKSDQTLRLEVRQQGKAYVYYRKGLALKIGLDSFEVNEKYENVPELVLAKTNPPEYFQKIKQSIDIWVNNPEKKHRPEFDVQQAVAAKNQNTQNKYLILDMEYNFAQDDIAEPERLKQAGFDLLGIERRTNKAVFFEVKKGLNALRGNAGIRTHIEDFENFLYKNKNQQVFRDNLTADLKNILQDKITLGLITDYQPPQDFNLQTVELVFIYEPLDPESKTERQEYERIFENECRGITDKNYKTIFVSPGNYELL